MLTEVPEEVVEAPTITTSKRHLDRYMDRINLAGYGPSIGRWDRCTWGMLVSVRKLS